MSRTQAAEAPEAGVSFPAGTSGSRLLAELLEQTVQAFPGAFGALRVPRGKELRQRYAELVTQFEGLRAASPQRAAIALFVARRQLELFRFQGAQGNVPLLEALEEKAAPFALARGAGEPELQPVVEIPYRGKLHRGAEVTALAQDLLARRGATRAAAQALSWVAARGGDTATLDLRGHAFAVLGASAEIAPTELLLRAGARLLWIDVKDPPTQLQRANLSWVQGGADLLLAPARIARTLEQFAGEAPLHLVACAYAPGRGREWRLAVSMNAIAHKLKPGAVASLTLLVSPTCPAPIEPEDIDAIDARRASAHLWQAALARAGLLRPPLLRVGPIAVARSVVPIQGPTYQAAQYAAKRVSAEAFAAYGCALDPATPAPLRVSANVAPITKTRSLRHPLFEAAFIGAPTFGVEIFEPASTRAIGLLLALHDLLNPEAPAATLREPQHVGELFQKHVHGGIFGLPWALEMSINVSALLGLGQRPSLLLKLLR